MSENTYEPTGGEDIVQAAKAASRQARMNDADVTFTFNDITLIVKPQHDPADVVNFFWMQSATKRDEWVRSEEGIKSLVAQLESRKRAEAAEKEPLATFALRDAEGWRKCINNNSDGYGSCVVRYAARWANLMEKRIAEGKTIAECAKQASHDADVEGITGFMYGCAVSILAGAWAHGEELRRWHNLSTQLKNEGEKANESGGVLNPALLNIG
jgi:hypothetical protein